MTNGKYLCCYFMICFSSLSFAGKDPISWRVDRSFPATVYLGRTVSTTYTFTNQLPVKLVKPLKININTSLQIEFLSNDQCSGQRLSPGQSCQVEMVLEPTVVGEKFVELSISGYDNNIVRLPRQTTLAIEHNVPSGDVTGTVTNSLPAQTTVGTSENYSFSFTNKGDIDAEDVIAVITQLTGTSINITSNTCGDATTPGTLLANESCTVTGSYIPVSTAVNPQEVQISLTFSGPSGSPVVLSTETTAVAPLPTTSNIIGTTVSPNYFPPVMLGNQSYPIQFLFTNTTSNSITLGAESITCTASNGSNCNGFFTIGTAPGDNSCLNSPLAPHAACQILGSFSAPAASNPVVTYTLRASLAFTGQGSPAQVSTIGTIVPSLPTTRTVTLINQCTFPVWFSLNGSAVSNTSCDASGNGCPPNTSCNKSTGLCYWNNPGPNTGTSYQLTQNGGQNTVTIPAANYNGVQWSGNISASTLCNGTTCGQASCNNNGGTTSCAPGQGFSQPATQAEITMLVDQSDSYDVEVINGFHLPISMAPVYYPGVTTPANNYECGVPGSSSSGNGFGACNWQNAVLPAPTGGTLKSSGYYWVTNSGTSCNPTVGTSQCSSGQVCGLAFNTSNATFSQVCGNFLGYWSADQVCSYTNLPSSISTFFKCNQSLPTSNPPFPAGSTLYQLMACSVPTGDQSPLYNSCYLNYSGYTDSQIMTCCGCIDWWNHSYNGSPIVTNSSTQSCGTQIDPQWTQYVLPMLEWMKAACPSAYTYPFDDKTSGFTCSNNLPGEPNSVGYTITFCPGNSGLPTGLTDGR